MRKIQVRHKDGLPIRSNLYGIYKSDYIVIKEIESFLKENNISNRLRNDWLKKTKKGIIGHRFLNYIIFYKDEDVNLFMLMLGHRFTFGEIENRKLGAVSERKI